MGPRQNANSGLPPTGWFEKIPHRWARLILPPSGRADKPGAGRVVRPGESRKSFVEKEIIRLPLNRRLWLNSSGPASRFARLCSPTRLAHHEHHGNRFRRGSERGNLPLPDADPGTGPPRPPAYPGLPSQGVDRKATGLRSRGGRGVGLAPMAARRAAADHRRRPIAAYRRGPHAHEPGAFLWRALAVVWRDSLCRHGPEPPPPVALDVQRSG